MFQQLPAPPLYTLGQLVDVRFVVFVAVPLIQVVDADLQFSTKIPDLRLPFPQGAKCFGKDLVRSTVFAGRDPLFHQSLEFGGERKSHEGIVRSNGNESKVRFFTSVCFDIRSAKMWCPLSDRDWQNWSCRTHK
jgi:hypothetical protein